MSCFPLITKQRRHSRRLTSDPCATCDVTTDDGATLYVYVIIYAAIH